MDLGAKHVLSRRIGLDFCSTVLELGSSVRTRVGIVTGREGAGTSTLDLAPSAPRVWIVISRFALLRASLASGIAHKLGDSGCKRVVAAGKRR